MSIEERSHPTEHRTPIQERPARMGRLARLPLFVALDGKAVLVAGGGPAAAWKAELLSASGARVAVHAEAVSDEMLQLAGEPPGGAVVLHRQGWTPGDLSDCALAVGAFDDDEEATAFAAAARAAGVPVNVVDKPAFCDFSFGAIVNRSPLVIGISTDGAAPIFAQAIRARLEAMLPKGFAAWSAAAKTWRAVVQVSGLSRATQRRFWQRFTAHALARPQDAPAEAHLAGFLAHAKADTVGDDLGAVTLVGAGPGDPELLTLRAVRALQGADVILFDDLVSRDVLDFARREARKLLVGKTGYGPSCKQDDINALMVGLARRGRRVVRLKSGDPLIFARAGEELAACRAAGIPVEVVPGITAAQGAASRLGVALTGRGRARRLQFVTGHAQTGGLPEDLEWASLADAATTTAIYMPTRTLSALVARALAAGLDPATPAVAVARATRADQAVVSGPIADLPARIAAAELPGPLLVILGQAVAQDDVAAVGPDRRTTAAAP